MKKNEERLNLFVCCHESGDPITECKDIDDGIRIIDNYEEQDKNEGVYEDGFYDICNVEGKFSHTVWYEGAEQ